MLKRLCAAALALMLASCAVPTPRQVPSPRPAGAPPPVLKSMPAAGLYRIDADHSELRILVYRAGPLANFGHNHVIVNRQLSGSLTVGSSLETSSFALSIPVNAFSVDDAAARSEEGEDFPGEIAAAAKEGTLRNMLGEGLLDAANHPTIEIRGEQLEETHGSLNATMSIEIAGRDANIAAPFVFGGSRQGLDVRASFELRQTELGLTPFSLLGGALQVRDAIHIKLSLTAVAVSPP